jgi:hypothetical protein
MPLAARRCHAGLHNGGVPLDAECVRAAVLRGRYMLHSMNRCGLLSLAWVPVLK